VVDAGTDDGEVVDGGPLVEETDDVPAGELVLSEEQAATIAEAPRARKTRRETGNSGNIGSVNQPSTAEVVIGCDHTRSGPACSCRLETPIRSTRTRSPTSSAQKRRP